MGATERLTGEKWLDLRAKRWDSGLGDAINTQVLITLGSGIAGKMMVRQDRVEQLIALINAAEDLLAACQAVAYVVAPGFPAAYRSDEVDHAFEQVVAAIRAAKEEG